MDLHIDNKFKDVRDRFYRNVKRINSFSEYVLKHTDDVIGSNKLKMAASRISVPQVFEPYKVYCEEALDTQIPANFNFTVEDIKQSDLKAIESFSIPGKLNKINMNLFIACGLQSAYELGILEHGKTSIHEKITPQESADSYERGTSSSYPLYKKKGDPESNRDAVEWTEKFVKRPDVNNIMHQPTTVFHRFQIKVGKDFSDITKKIRAVWGISFRVLCLEGIYYRNLVNAVTKFNLEQRFPATTLGRTKYDISLNILPHLRDLNNRIVSLDFSAFDSTICQEFFALFHAIVFFSIKKDNKMDERILDLLMYFYVYTPYCWFSNKLKFQKRGTPSGSLLTATFNTWVTRTMLNYACMEYTNGRNYIEKTGITLGDDVTFSEEYVSAKHVYRVAERMGFTINVDKTSISGPNEPINLLGYIWTEDNEPTQTIGWYVAHLVVPSRFFRDTGIPNSLLQTYRGISICMQLKDGMQIFEQLVGWADIVWKDIKQQYRDTGQASIVWVTEDAQKMGTVIPIHLIYSEGWKAF